MAVAALTPSPLCSLQTPSLETPHLCSRRPSYSTVSPGVPLDSPQHDPMHLRGSSRQPGSVGSASARRNSRCESQSSSPYKTSSELQASSLMSPVTDEASSAPYSVHMEAWVSIQVDKRLNHILEDIVETQLTSAREDCAAAMSRADYLDCEMTTVVEAQSKLLAMVESMSQELARSKSANQAQAEACQLAEKLMSTADTLQANLAQESHDFAALKRRVADSEAAVIELRTWQNTSLEHVRSQLDHSISIVVNDLQRLQDMIEAVRMETVKESSAIMLLDEQLWLTDQRCSQGLDKLANEIFGHRSRQDERRKECERARVSITPNHCGSTFGVSSVSAEIKDLLAGVGERRGPSSPSLSSIALGRASGAANPVANQLQKASTHDSTMSEFEICPRSLSSEFAAAGRAQCAAVNREFWGLGG